MVITDLACPRGEARTYTATATTPVNVTGWNFAFTVREPDSRSLIFQVLSGAGITVTDVVNGILEIALTATQTLVIAQEYDWDLWRTDAGFEDQLGKGVFTVTDSYRI